MNSYFSGIRSVIILLAAFLLGAYSIWEWHWYTLVSFAFIKWHTHLMVYAYIGTLLFLIYTLFTRYASTTIRNIFLVFCSIVFALFIAEVFLSISGAYKTSMEKILGSYASPYTQSTDNPYHVWGADGIHWLSKPEYSFERHTNSLGFSDKEWPIDKNKHEKRILALGDSFTEGDGAPYDSSYVALMRKMLSPMGDSIYLMNAGTCGSDPFINYINLRDHLLAYKPDIVIQSVGSGDLMSDIRIRGGMERFQKGHTTFAPWWEPLYAISYVSRIFFTFEGYDEQLLKPNAADRAKDRINKSVEDLFRDYSALCDQNNIKLFIVLHPQKRELDENTYGYDFSPIIKYLSSDPRIKIIDLIPFYHSYIHRTGTTSDDYYWKTDGHHNSKGYEMMAESTLKCIAPYLHDTITNPK
jgi:lysophospholipase L1-like esterase